MTTGFNPDAPIAEAKQDRFVFSPFAQGLARQIANYDHFHSFTIGICGPWGSGKTSLINLVCEALEKDLQNGGHNEHAVILPYSPWLVGNRDALLRELLPAVANGIRKQVPEKKRTFELKTALKFLDLYGRAIKGVELGLGVSIATATAFGVAVSPWLASAVVCVGGIVKFLPWVKPKPATLDELRKSAQAALQVAKVRVLVIIDDLDRLDPSEIVEMARLIRSTLDLPHMTFLIAYDRHQVAQSISAELKVDGANYLEKIVQLQVDVPAIAPFDLARTLGEELQIIFGNLDEEQVENVRTALWDGAKPLFLRKPRDVARIANAVSFGWSMVNRELDPGDLLFITCLRIQAPKTYQWCWQYCMQYFANDQLVLGHRNDIDKFQELLIQACEEDDIERDTLLRVLGSLLPGIEPFSLTHDQTELFNARDLQQAAASMRDHRLASPEHWRKYFDLVDGRYGITDRDFATFLDEAVSNSRAAMQSLIEYARPAATDPSGIRSSERLLDRLRAEAHGGALDARQRVAIVSVMSNALDEIEKSVGPATLFGVSQYELARWALRDLLQPLEAEDRVAALRDAASNGAAISWLSYVLRGELIRLREGREQESRGEALLSEADLNAVNAVLLRRIREVAASGNLLDLDPLVDPLLFWFDIDDSRDHLRQAVENAVSDDADFVKFLLSLKHLVRSTAGDYWRIDNSLVSRFYDIERAVERLQQILNGSNSALMREAQRVSGYMGRDG